MEYRKLNFIDGPESDLHTFIQLVIRAFERKETGSAARINFDIISKAAAMGVITGVIAEDKGAAVGVQVWENLDVWFNNQVKHNFCRVTFLEESLATPTELALFTQAGIRLIHSGNDATLIVTQAGDQLLEHAANMGLHPYATTWSVNV